MTLELLIRKFNHYIILILCLIALFFTQKQIEISRVEIDYLEQGRKNLIQKLESAKKKKLLREKIMTEFRQFQRSGLFAIEDLDNLTGIVEQLCDRSGLKKVSYQIKPIEKKRSNNLTLHWHKIIFELNHHEDRTIFQFIETLSHKIPGVVIPEHLLLARADPLLSEKDLTKEVSGYYHFYLITFDPSAISIP